MSLEGSFRLDYDIPDRIIRGGCSALDDDNQHPVDVARPRVHPRCEAAPKCRDIAAFEHRGDPGYAAASLGAGLNCHRPCQSRDVALDFRRIKGAAAAGRRRQIDRIEFWITGYIVDQPIVRTRNRHQRKILSLRCQHDPYISHVPVLEVVVGDLEDVGVVADRPGAQYVAVQVLTECNGVSIDEAGVRVVILFERLAQQDRVNADNRPTAIGLELQCHPLDKIGREDEIVVDDKAVAGALILRPKEFPHVSQVPMVARPGSSILGSSR